MAGKELVGGSGKNSAVWPCIELRCTRIEKPYSPSGWVEACASNSYGCLNIDWICAVCVCFPGLTCACTTLLIKSSRNVEGDWKKTRV